MQLVLRLSSGHRRAHCARVAGRGVFKLFDVGTGRLVLSAAGATTTRHRLRAKGRNGGRPVRLTFFSQVARLGGMGTRRTGEAFRRCRLRQAGHATSACGGRALVAGVAIDCKWASGTCQQRLLHVLNVPRGLTPPTTPASRSVRTARSSPSCPATNALLLDVTSGTLVMNWGFGARLRR